MKNIRQFVLTMILMIIVLILCTPAKVFATYSIGDKISISENSMSKADNIYCVSHGKNFGGIKGMDYRFDFRVAAYVELEGKKATGISSSGATINCESDDNATLAAILGGPLQRGYGSYNKYNEAQKALYTFWNTWVGSVGGQYGFSADSANGNINGSSYVQKAKNAATTTNYKAVVYLLVPTGNSAAYNVQELIAVDALAPENPPETPEEPDTPGEKSKRTTVTGYVNISGFVWEDIANSKNNSVNSQYNDADGDKKLEGIRVHWKSGNTELASTVTGTDGSYKLQTTLDLYNHPYGIKDKTKYDQINNSHIEFEYNGLKYTTVAFNGNLSDATTSKGKENEGDRVAVDNKFDRVEDEAVWDGNNAIISGLPNTEKTEANYSSEFATTASTGNIVGGLLNIAESNSWTDKKTFCAKHCTADSQKHETATIPITREYGDAYYHTDYWEDRDGDPTNGDEYHVQEDYRRDSATVNVHIYCYGKPIFDEDPHGILTSEDYSKYSRAPEGNEFNSYSGAHYYSADETDGPTTRDCLNSIEGIYQWNIYNMNLGLVRREQPDVALTSDIEKVRVIMKGQEYTYIYGNRGIQNNEELFDYKVKFQNKYVEQQYSRPVNPSDIAYVNYNNTDDLKVYVTYNVIAKNQSTTLPVTIKKIVNYYDPNYTIYTGERTATSSGWTESNETNNGYKVAYNTMLDGKVLNPETKSEIVKIEFEISQDAIKGLLNNNSTLYNVSEIFSFTTYYGGNTMCAERETAETKGKIGQQYAGLDLDSTPGNATPGKLDTYEDDTDKAPAFLLMKDPNYKTMTGIVYEDTQTTESKNKNERLGNGQRDDGEKGVANVKVELLNADGTPAYLYYKNSNGKADKKLAVTYTDSEGNYTFGTQSESGVVVDKYIIKFTYGNDTTVLENGATTINGNEINARNYKSTIITESNVKGVMQGNNSEKWHLYMDRNLDTSIAVDDINERLAIPSLKYSNYDTPVNMSAYSKIFDLQVEYTPEDKQESKVGNDGGDFEYDWQVFDFGIIERAREDITIEKTISKIKIILANGQVLIEGNPTADSNIAYTKALGFKNRITNRGTSLSALDKLLSIEIDSELIQGATMEVWYAITVNNNSEKDYEYETNAKYYYYGDSTGLEVLSKTVELVADYMDSELDCQVGEQAINKVGDVEINNNEWHMYDSSTSDYMKPNDTGTPIIDIIKEHGYVSYKIDEAEQDKTYETLKNGKYSIFVTETFNGVKPGEQKTSILYASKLLGNKEEEHSYENHVEIIQLNSKIARTIDSVKDDTREQVVKTYKPGNYIPSFADRVINTDGTLELEGLHQPDDDRVRIIITPPTGILNYVTTYIIVAVVALIVIVGGVIFIKKRVIKQ